MEVYENCYYHYKIIQKEHIICYAVYHKFLLFQNSFKYYERIAIFFPLILNLGIFASSSELNWSFHPQITPSIKFSD